MKIPTTTTSLVEGLKNDDEQAWAHFAKFYAPVVFHICRSSSKFESKEEADGEAKIILERIHDYVIANFKKKKKHGLRNYVRTIVHSRISDFERRSHRQERKANKHTLAPGFDEHIKRRAIAVAKEESKILKRTWTIFHMYFDEKRSYEDIAAKLGIKPNSVERSISRALKTVMAKLNSVS